MFKIMKITRKNSNELAQIDFESEHLLEKGRTFESYKKELNRRFKQDHEIFFGYKEKGELKGYITIKPFFPGHKHGEIYWVAVKKKYQGQGIGRKLIEFAEKYLKKKGFRKVCLYTGKNMVAARKFYEKRGYKMINEFPGYYGYSSGNTTAVLYAKEI